MSVDSTYPEAASNLDAAREPERSGLSGFLAALPASGAFLLPVGACPACWPAYTAFLGWLGLGFLFSERYLLPIAAASLALTLGTLAYRARGRRGYGPFWLASAGAAGAILGRFVLSSDFVLYFGLTAILAAAGWNVRPKRQATACPRCSASPSPQLET